MKVTVIIPVYNEEKYIDNCLQSIINSNFDFTYTDSEIIVADGNSTDRTKEIVEAYTKQYSYIKLIENKSKYVPGALNAAIRISKGDTIIRMDAHAEYSDNYINKLLDWKEKLKADNVGAVCITEIKNKNYTSSAIKKVLSNKFGIGNSLFRIGVSEPTEVDTVPFGCFHKSVFEKIGYFDERLIRNQDIEFNKRIKQNGGKIFLIPYEGCKYFAREDYYSIALNNFKNGLWNILTVFLTGSFKSLSIRHFIPLTFVSGLLISLIAGLFFPFFLWCFISVLFLYLSFIIILSIKLKDKETTVFHIVWAFISLHFSYGFGSLFGLFKVMFRKKKKI